MIHMSFRPLRTTRASDGASGGRRGPDTASCRVTPAGTGRPTGASKGLRAVADPAWIGQQGDLSRGGHAGERTITWAGQDAAAMPSLPPARPTCGTSSKEAG
jgi:hypothetical protein